jgi:RNA exonuclease 1
MVGGSKGETVILDTLVQPSMPVVDMVTQIHGISKDHLSGVSYTLRHAQAAMAQLVRPETVLVGHALDNDLKSLKFNHARVVDTALIYRSSEGRTCSLRELAVALLGSEQESPHDSISDAQIGPSALSK